MVWRMNLILAFYHAIKMKTISNLRKPLAFRGGLFWADEQGAVTVGRLLVKALDYSRNPNSRKCVNYANKIEETMRVQKKGRSVQFNDDEFDFIKKAVLNETLVVIPAYIKNLVEENFEDEDEKKEKENINKK